MKQIKFIITIIVSLICFKQVSGQIIPEWATSYAVNYPVSIEGSDMVTDKNGNVYVTGYKSDTSSYYYTIVTLKYDQSGILQWVQSYDSLSYFSRITVDDLGNVYISGHWDSNLWVIKYNTLGTLQWAKPFLSSGPSTWSWDIIADDLSNVYLTALANGNRYTTLKYNSSGILLWAVSDSVVNGSSNSYIALDNNKNVYITGRGDTVGYGSVCKTIKYNSAGIKQWSRIYTSNFSPGLSGPRDLKYDANGFIYLLASSTNNNNGNGDIVVVKYDTLGNQLWVLSNSFTSYYDVPKSMAIDKLGNVYVTGNIWPTGGTIDSLLTFKISKSGIFKWKKTYSAGYSNNDEACGIAIDSSGAIYVGGKSGGSFQKENYVAIKYDSLGNTLWVGRYHNTTFSSDEAYSLSLDKNGNVFLSGTTRETNTSGVLTIKLSNTVGIQEFTSGSNSQVRAFPNPFETSITIKSDKILTNAELVIYNPIGQIVYKLDQIHNNIITIQRNNLSDGIYFFKISENGQILATGKIIAK